MWPKKYADYPVDESLVNQPVEPGKGIVGCEMHDRNGWGETDQITPLPRRGFLMTLLALFQRKKED